MAETLESGGPLSRPSCMPATTDPAEFWKPDGAFFDLLRDKRAITRFIAEAISPEAAPKPKALTAKAQKGHADTGAGAAARPQAPDWRPGWMQVPPTRHVEGAGSAPADAWDRIAGLFEGRGDAVAPGTERQIDQPDAA
jgi:ParB family chromosome partitioning protein